MKDFATGFDRMHTETVSQIGRNLGPAWKEHSGTPESDRASQSATAGGDVLTSCKSGRLQDELCRVIDEAQHMLVICSFLLASGPLSDAIERASRRNVRVYVLLASETRLKQEPNEGEFEAKCRTQHEDMLSRLAGAALFRSSEQFHAKIVLADPQDEGISAGILLTANLTDEALMRNEELAVRLKKEEISEAFSTLRYALWEMAEHETFEGQFRPIKPLGSVTLGQSGTSILSTISGEKQELMNASLEMIERAGSRIVISSFGWDANSAIVNALSRRAKEGVEVTVLCRRRASAMPALLDLAKAGATVFGFKWLHAKAIWTDSDEGLVMSANFQKHGMERGFELGVRLTDTRLEELERALMTWTAGGCWRLFPEATLEDSDEKLILWSQNKLEEVEVRASLEKKLPPLNARSADALDVRPESFPEPEEICRKIFYLWQVRAPRLSKKAKPLKLEKDTGKRDSNLSSDEVRLFREPNDRRVVAINDPSQIELARLIKNSGNADAIVVSERKS